MWSMTTTGYKMYRHSLWAFGVLAPVGQEAEGVWTVDWTNIYPFVFCTSTDGRGEEGGAVSTP